MVTELELGLVYMIAGKPFKLQAIHTQFVHPSFLAMAKHHHEAQLTFTEYFLQKEVSDDTADQ